MPRDAGGMGSNHQLSECRGKRNWTRTGGKGGRGAPVEGEVGPTKNNERTDQRERLDSFQETKESRVAISDKIRLHADI